MGGSEAPGSIALHLAQPEAKLKSYPNRSEEGAQLRSVKLNLFL